MARVSTTIQYVDLDGDYGSVDGVQVSCDRCGHYEESFGTGDGSLKRCALLLRENCPQGENNYYDVG
jgi:hypothetical protein